MFHIKQLEVVHWDFWRRFTLPLDAQIITIVGPNGSGKTTLLDALRTLFALRCSGKRDFRRYVRRGDRSFAWIRAVVANAPTPSGRRPFFPCLNDEVTLACRIRRAGGEWTRDYTIVDGDQSIEALEHAEEWIGLRDYQHRLAWGGLTPAIAKVLALEQGDTDKLCEYSPKALLDLVFDVFGDKEVLDNYEAARQEQASAERELEDLALDLERLRAQAEARRLEADNYLQWKQLGDEVTALDQDIIPRLEALELARDSASERAQLAAERQEYGQRQRDRLQAAQALQQVEAEKAAAETARSALKSELKDAEQHYLSARDEVRDLEKQLAERDALRAQLAAEHGADAVALEREHEQAEATLTRLRREERELVARYEECTESLRQARQHRAPVSAPDVQRFRSLLDEQGIAHCALAEIIEIVDPAWQGALEAILRPHRHVLLLERESDRHAAWALGERERFRHFIVPERATAPSPKPGSLAEVVRFTAPVPRWLSDLLNRIQRVDNTDAARDLPRDVEWITRDAYHRERRGARHLGRPQDFHFGELARQGRLTQLENDIRDLDQQLSAVRPQVQAAANTLTQLRQRLLGLQSGQLLAARSESYAHAEQTLPQARERLAQATAHRDALHTRQDQLANQLAGIQIEIDRRQRETAAREQRLAELSETLAPRRQAQAQRLRRLRSLTCTLPPDWRDPDEIERLTALYDSAAAARRERDRLRLRLTEGDWSTDPAVLTLYERLKADVGQRERDYRDRQGYCATAKRLTEEARNAYIAKLRATVRQYSKNLKALGELAGVDVDCPLPVLAGDDVSLAQAGLEVRFDFDRKGAVGLNDGEASGGQQVMKSLILLIALLMDEARPGGFVFIDEPFAHLDIANIDRVGTFLRATRAQYLITTPVTHNANVFAPAQLTLVTRKKQPGDSWAPTIGVLTRQPASH